MTQDERTICVGKIVGAHGLRGLVRLRSFTEDPAAIAQYAVADEMGRPRKVTLKTPMAEEFIAEVEGVTTREQAEAARGLRLFVARDQLPKLSAREYYLADLVGLRAEDTVGKVCGTVLAVHDFGAGAVLEFKLSDGRTAMLPFRDAFIPTVALQEGRIVISPPADWLEAAPQERRA